MHHGSILCDNCAPRRPLTVVIDLSELYNFAIDVAIGNFEAIRVCTHTGCGYHKLRVEVWHQTSVRVASQDDSVRTAGR